MTFRIASVRTDAEDPRLVTTELFRMTSSWIVIAEAMHGDISRCIT